MSLTYNIALQKAVENGVYVIGACGFDSIPADLGQICVRREMEGDVNSVETYLQVIVPDLPGATINFATFQVGNFNDLCLDHWNVIAECHPWICPRQGTEWTEETDLPREDAGH